MVRIQEERGQTVVKDGLYKFVQHPGYLGSLFFLVFTPIMLDSWWGLILAILTYGIVFLRTYLEDETLKVELPGYQEYTAEVRFSLIPGIC